MDRGTFAELVQPSYPIAMLLAGGEWKLARRILLHACLTFPRDEQRQRRREKRFPDDLKGRRRMLLTPAQLFQLQVFSVSEKFERESERGGHASLTEELLLLRFLKLLMQYSLLHTSFHAAVSVTRVLYRYQTTEALEIHSHLTQDPTGGRDEATCRRIKGQVLGLLLERFGPLIREEKGRRNERLLHEDKSEKAQQALHAYLETLAPVGTSCYLPKSALRGSAEEELGGAWARLDCEIERIHALFHVPCLERLSRELRLSSPDSKLAVPKFFLSKSDANSGDSSMPPPTQFSPGRGMPKEELAELWEDVRGFEGLIANSRVQNLCLLINGNPFAELNLEDGSMLRIALPPYARTLEFVATIGEEDVPLLAWPVFRDEDDQPVDVHLEVSSPRCRLTLLLPGGLEVPTESRVEIRSDRAREQVPLNVISWLRPRLPSRLVSGSDSSSLFRSPWDLYARIATSALLVGGIAMGLWSWRTSVESRISTLEEESRTVEANPLILDLFVGPQRAMSDNPEIVSHDALGPLILVLHDPSDRPFTRCRAELEGPDGKLILDIPGLKRTQLDTFVLLLSSRDLATGEHRVNLFATNDPRPFAAYKFVVTP